MPKISLVVCVYKERDLLERLLENVEGCYDDLVVVHDGQEHSTTLWQPGYPDPRLAIDWSMVPENSNLPEYFFGHQTEETPGSIRELVLSKGGRFYEHPRVGSLEGQSPFAWWAAKHDWLLRLDADEIPSDALKSWLKNFRQLHDIDLKISGFTCIWPPWDGERQISTNFPEWRPFLIHKRRTKYFGLTEQGPIPDFSWQTTGLILEHRPKRKSYGIGNLIFRRQAYLWRKSIALCLQGSPLALPRWRWQADEWPPYWSQIRRSPVLTGLNRCWQSIPREIISRIRSKKDFLLGDALGTALHKLLVPLAFAFYRIKSPR